MKKIDITAVIIAKNEEEMLPGCLDTLSWCSDLLIIDDGSVDTTVAIAEKKGARVISFKHPSFARLRNEALKYCKTSWIFYIDADERVTPTLAKEILVQVETSDASALSCNRSNFFLGKEFTHGGWEDDVVTRIFKTDSLQQWTGKVHESPEFSGTVTQLKTPLIHFSHRDIASGLFKSASWTGIEAELLHKSELPTVSVGTILRKGIMEFIRRGFLKGGYKDGQAGLIEALVQGINRMLVYMQVWELQQKPPITDTYQSKEQEIQKLWKDA